MTATAIRSTALTEAGRELGKPLTEDEARALTVQIRASVQELLPLIRRAYQRRADLALGYGSWDDYCDAELSGLRMSVADRPEAVAALRSDGMSQRAIGSALGISAATVNRTLATVSPETVPDRVTGIDGREQPATRPAPKPIETPEPAAVPSTAAAGSGSTSPELERHLSVVPEPEPPRSEEAEELRAEILRDSHLRATVASVRSVVLYLTSRVLKPAELAERYAIALDEFTAAELRFAAETMAAIAALKEQ